ncbi:phage portal protein [Arsenicicoccus dermatophilus]|uniref:phage portal protein n=1 Tax=Arsenicicoccus dermatophilus TaxID=1076331 RepID=UPI001F4C9C4B|nr:phage portal protein [Arsenicicoccus dermatophilus]MCH8611779.1 phage portal protein [Arsenicicoccus dermatophilus]MCH8612326.1 phage portal protein [Arsenicicoccus dermatophilus]
MPTDLLTTLLTALDAPQARYAALDRYYAGTQPLAFLAPEAREALGERLTTMSSNLPRLAVTSLAERLRVTGFTLDGKPATQLWEAWRRNDLDQLAGVAHREALALGSAYVATWAGEDGKALVTVESARQVVTIHDPATREVTAAIKRWEDAQGTHAVVYTADTIRHHFAPQAGATAGFRVVERIDNPLGVVPVTPLHNTDRLLGGGVSEMADLLPLVDALSKLLADMLVGSEYYARPRRWATGVELAEDADGNAANPFAEGIKMMVSESPDTKFGSLPAADLSAYTDAVNVVTSQIMAVSGLPAHYVGVLSNQPSSADALRASEASLTARAEARQQVFGRAWERVARLVLAVENGVDPATVAPSVSWADPATRSVAQEADAVVKLYSAGLLPASAALRRLGYSDSDIDAIRRDMSADAVSRLDLGGVVAR